MQIVIADIRIPPTYMYNLGRIQESVIMHSLPCSKSEMVYLKLLKKKRKKSYRRVYILQTLKFYSLSSNRKQIF